MKFLLLALLAVGAVAVRFECAHAEEPVAKFYLGANGVWSNGDLNLPSAFEVGGNARASLSPHISAVGSAYYGLDPSYLVGKIGARVTVSDVTNPNFSIGVGIQYQASSKPSVRPQEWIPDVTLGWRPYPQTMPKIVLVAQGGYGLTSNQAIAMVGVRYSLNYEEEAGANP